MAYETGTASSLDDLLTKVVAFAVANAGFTEITKITGTGKQSDMYILQKGSMYWWFLGDSITLTNYGTNGYLTMRMMKGAIPTLANRQNTAYSQYYDTAAQLWNRYNGPYTAYTLYSNGNSVQVVVEVTPLVFTHWSFGVVDKFGTWTGGEFVTGSYTYGSSSWNSTTQLWTYNIPSYGCNAFSEGFSTLNSIVGLTFVHYPQGSFGNYLDFAPTTATVSGTLNQRARLGGPYQIVTNTAQLLTNNLIDMLMYCSPNSFNLRTALIPTYLQLYDQSSQRYHMLGHIDNVKAVNIEFTTPKDTIELEWDVYPIFQKAGDQSVSPISGYAGLAYRRA